MLASPVLSSSWMASPSGAADTTAPYAWSWNTATTANGQYTLTARARDAAGNGSVSTPLVVTVSNVGGAARTLGQTAIGGTLSSDAANHINAWRSRDAKRRLAPPRACRCTSPVPWEVPRTINFRSPSTAIRVALLVHSLRRALRKLSCRTHGNTAPLSGILQPNTAYWLAYNTNGPSASTNNIRLAPGTANQMRWRVWASGT